MLLQRSTLQLTKTAFEQLVRYIYIMLYNENEAIEYKRQNKKKNIRKILFLITESEVF